MILRKKPIKAQDNTKLTSGVWSGLSREEALSQLKELQEKFPEALVNLIKSDQTLYNLYASQLGKGTGVVSVPNMPIRNNENNELFSPASFNGIPVSRIYTNEEDFKKEFEAPSGRYCRNKIKVKDAYGNSYCTRSALQASPYSWYNVWKDAEGKWINSAGQPGSGVNAWDVQNAVNASDDAFVYYDYFRDGPLTEEIKENLPFGSLLQYGKVGTGFGVNKEYGEQRPRHTTALAGVILNGEKPAVYNFGNPKIAEKDIFTEFNPRYPRTGLTKIVAPTKFKNVSIHDVVNMYKDFAKSQKFNNIDTKLTDKDYEIWKTAIKANGDDLDESFLEDIDTFYKSLNKYSDKIKKDYNLNDYSVDLIKRLLLGIAVQESGTTGDFAAALDHMFGSSTGLTQLLTENRDKIKDQHTIPKTVNSFLLTPESSAYYSMALMANNLKDLENLSKIKKGTGSYYQPKTFGLTGKPAKVLKKIIPKLSAPNDYTMSLADISLGPLTMIPKYLAAAFGYDKVKTTGNADLSDAEILAYMWNNPGRIVSGDAGGYTENSYIKNVLNYAFPYTTKTERFQEFMNKKKRK